MPGSFAEIRRLWRNGDHMELDLPLVNRLEAVDAQHPDIVALVNGSLVRMASRSDAREAAPELPQEPFTRAVLLSAKQISTQSDQWTAGTGAGILRLKPFLDIQDEKFTT